MIFFIKTVIQHSYLQILANFDPWSVHLVVQRIWMASQLDCMRTSFQIVSFFFIFLTIDIKNDESHFQKLYTHTILGIFFIETLFFSISKDCSLKNLWTLHQPQPTCPCATTRNGTFHSLDLSDSCKEFGLLHIQMAYGK